MKASVLMLAYNHERYIAQAIESALGQQTEFPFELVIGEDCSTDRTRDILRGYRDRYPDRIRLLLPERNLGMMENLIQTCQACRGAYIAILEGDDYWTSPHKLQSQVDFLETNPGFSECFHNVEVVVEGRPDENRPFLSELKGTYTLEDVVGSNFIPTCATVFRAASLPTFPEWFAAMPMGDWPLHVFLAEKGAIGCIPEIMGAYRVHGGGAWSGSSRVAIIERSLVAARQINRHLGFRFDLPIRNSMVAWRREAATLLLEQKAYRQALSHATGIILLLPKKQNRRFFAAVVRQAVAGLLRQALAS
jgi:glycosyltransferase involved in cell wall biosynthesis